MRQEQKDRISKSQRERYERERRDTARLAWLREAVENECVILEAEAIPLNAEIRKRMARRLREALAEQTKPAE